MRGVVQGVGFRPTVARLAAVHGLDGTVQNTASGVEIVLLGPAERRQAFLSALQAALPPRARLAEWRVSSLESGLESAGQAIEPGFRILPSAPGAEQAAPRVTPDFATCPECRLEVMDPLQRRYRYPFTACTHCGPRYSVVQGVPYDRERTTLSEFPLCPECQAEYGEAADRRFHAQALCCWRCGPRAWLERADGRAFSMSRYSMLDEVDAAGSLLMLGEQVALKALGGFHLLTDACNEASVALLRQRKRRPVKPLALLARDLDVVCRYARVSPREADLLQSPQAPIVLLEPLPAAELDPATRPLAPTVAPHQGALGFMLPSTPLHQLVMRRLQRPVVCTSGNLSDEPQCTSEDEARERLGGIADWLLMHDRPIENRVDDSLVRVMAGAPRVLRRARGYAPDSLPLPPGLEGAPPVLAVGGQFKNTLCLTQEGQATLSPHIGDLDDSRAFQAWQETLERLSGILGHQPRAIAVDRHPGYRSGEIGRNLARARDLPLIEVQHHHAHLAACLAEHQVPADAPPVLGLALDGLGFGDDGQLWGGELLLADYAGYERVGTLKPVALLGGDLAAQEPWRNLYAHLRAEQSRGELEAHFGDVAAVRGLLERATGLVDQALANERFSPRASSCGRLFDAVAAALALFPERIEDEGQAAQALEASLTPADLQQAETEASRGEAYPLGVPVLNTGLPYLEPLGMWRALLGDLWAETRPGLIAARFHVALAEGLADLVRRARTPHEDVTTVALSGGCLQNKTLLELLVARLTAQELTVLTHQDVPPHDGGIALGQAAIAAAQLTQEP